MKRVALLHRNPASSRKYCDRYFA